MKYLQYLLQFVKDVLKAVLLRLVLISVVLMFASVGWISPELMERTIPLILA